MQIDVAVYAARHRDAFHTRTNKLPIQYFGVRDNPGLVSILDLITGAALICSRTRQPRSLGRRSQDHISSLQTTGKYGYCKRLCCLCGSKTPKRTSEGTRIGQDSNHVHTNVCMRACEVRARSAPRNLDSLACRRTPMMYSRQSFPAGLRAILHEYISNPH